jgi:hypothetical protein
LQNVEEYASEIGWDIEIMAIALQANQYSFFEWLDSFFAVGFLAVWLLGVIRLVVFEIG